MKKILVTGIAGFLGSHCAAQLIENGHRVIGIDNMSGGTASNVPEDAEYYEVDICDELAINFLFIKNRFDAIIHCAAFASENLSHNCALHTTRSIVQGTVTLLNAAINYDVQLFVNMSSIAVYGHGKPPFSEQDTPPLAADPYGAAKVCAELMLLAAEKNFGINTVTFRPHNIIGTRQSLADSTRNVASIFIRQVLSKKPLTIYGDGRQTRSWSPVSHVSRIIAACVDRPETWNSTYNIGGERTMQVFDLAKIICDLCGVSPEFDFLPERNEVKHARSSHNRVAGAFPDLMDDQESIENCLMGMIEEARRRPLPEIKPLPIIEISKKLNPAWTSRP